jgi:hypothetical protein
VTTIAGSGRPGHCNGLGTSSQFSHPHGLVLLPSTSNLLQTDPYHTAREDESVLIVADHWNHRLRKVIVPIGNSWGVNVLSFCTLTPALQQMKVLCCGARWLHFPRPHAPHYCRSCGVWWRRSSHLLRKV